MHWYARSSAAALAQTLRVRFPIVQAPMLGVSTPQLASAVSNAGGLGSIGLGGIDAATARSQLRSTRELTSKPFNVNFFCHEPARTDAAKERAWLDHLSPMFAEYGAHVPTTLSAPFGSFLDHADKMTEMLVEERPGVVSFHFGLPSKEVVQALRHVGIVTLACVTSPKEAALACDHGVDALIAQGYEAGGHRGVFDPSQDLQMGTLALIQLLKRNVPDKYPIIAAGGIMDGRGVRAAMTLGASGVQLGTAFVLCPESSADQAYREALQSDRAFKTQVSGAISGRPARGLVNRLFADLGGDGIEPHMPSYPIPYDGAKALDRAARGKGSVDFAVQWAGQSAPLARALPAAKLVELLVQEADLE